MMTCRNPTSGMRSARAMPRGRPRTFSGPGSRSSCRTSALLELVARGEIEIRGAATEDSSWLGVPLKAEDRTLGVAAVQSYTRDVQYTERDMELLAFVGQHIGVALSRARAIEETRQRNAELALINSVQAALAGELELQAIYDLVGDKIQEVFDAQVVDIGIYEPSSGLHPLPVHDRAGRAFPGRADLADRLPQARDGDA